MQSSTDLIKFSIKLSQDAVCQNFLRSESLSKEAIEIAIENIAESINEREGEYFRSTFASLEMEGKRGSTTTLESAPTGAMTIRYASINHIKDELENM